jgi:hypothetical protein
MTFAHLPTDELHLAERTEDLVTAMVDRGTALATSLFDRPTCGRGRTAIRVALVVATLAVLATVARKRFGSRTSTWPVSTPGGISTELAAEAKRRSEI